MGNGSIVFQAFHLSAFPRLAFAERISAGTPRNAPAIVLRTLTGLLRRPAKQATAAYEGRKCMREERHQLSALHREQVEASQKRRPERSHPFL